ncbi:MAG TPA: serine hydrolase domain-containing protein [Methylomirabilota bacterium]|nr:serine hydrolase domain-containing protein [Methylomirabilota bacterium]
MNSPSESSGCVGPSATGGRMDRRQFLGLCGPAAVAVLAGGCSTLMPPPPPAFPGALDRAMQDYMARLETPGGALAVVKDRRLVHARGYGWASGEERLPVEPESLFRIASLSKPITAVAVLRLVEQGELSLETRPFELLKLHRLVPPGRHLDERWKAITVRQLLQHTAGWDREKSFDPMFRAIEIARALQVPAPATAHDVIRYMLGQPLDFDPGTRYAYSNFGYCLLGRVIEAATGLTYPRYVSQYVLQPIGITRMQLGASRQSGRVPGEVRYYMPRPSLAPSVFSDEQRQVQPPYGGFHLEAMDAHGGWLASVVDLARFVAALDDFRHSPVLKEASLQIMIAPPDPPVARLANGRLAATYYGCGWSVAGGVLGRGQFLAHRQPAGHLRPPRPPARWHQLRRAVQSTLPTGPQGGRGHRPRTEPGHRLDHRLARRGPVCARVSLRQAITRPAGW